METRVAALVVLVALAACGGRTALGVEPCDAGSRPCETACGVGAQTCVDGRWSACDVPMAERPCEDACGSGIERCEHGVWEPCRVPVAVRACDAVCGPGTQRCEEGAWGACQGPATAERACESECGAGTQQCWIEAGWGPCETEPVERPCSTTCGAGAQRCARGRWGPCSASVPGPPRLSAYVRDFSSGHPDFEASVGSDRGIVELELGSDDRPVYRGLTPTTSGRESFDQWYRDVPGVNLGMALDLSLAPTSGDPRLFVYDDPSFFPIDGHLLGNEGREHNFHFTLEVSTEFVYEGGEVFRFRGDDDVFVFIDRRLVIDLGGVHSAEEATVSLDSLGLEPGLRYPIHVFFAERHTSESSFTIETTVVDRFVCE